MIGYALRLVTGYLADKTQRYWLLTIIGYAVNLCAVPLVGAGGTMGSCGMLMVVERVGKAIRAPARDAILSHATQKLGRGWGFGLHEFMDQIGAVSGPLIVAAAVYYKNDYRLGFAVLAIPALAAIGFLLTARFIYPRPRDFEPVSKSLKGKHFPKTFWLVSCGGRPHRGGVCRFCIGRISCPKNRLGDGSELFRYCMRWRWALMR